MQLCVVSVELEQYTVPIDNISDIFTAVYAAKPSVPKTDPCGTDMLTGTEHVV